MNEQSVQVTPGWIDCAGKTRTWIVRENGMQYEVTRKHQAEGLRDRLMGKEPAPSKRGTGKP